MPTGDRFRALAPNRELRTILWVAAAAVGLVAYIYVVGWIVELVRLSAARLPASAGVGALGDRQLLGNGLGSTLLMAAVFAVGGAIAARVHAVAFLHAICGVCLPESESPRPAVVRLIPQPLYTGITLGVARFSRVPRLVSDRSH